VAQVIHLIRRKQPCGVYIATRDKNEKFRAVMGNLYGTRPEETECLGCMQPDPPKKLCSYCKGCKIRKCVRSQGIIPVVNVTSGHAAG